MLSITLEHVARALLPAPRPGRALADSEWRTLARVAEVLLEGAPIDVTPERAASNVEAFLIAGRSRRAWRVRVLLTVIDLSTLATHRARFTGLSRGTRRAIVREKWMRGGHVWRVCAKVRNLVILGGYGDRSAAASTGYVPVRLRPRFQARHALAEASGQVP